jgi:hypothetical protein
MTLLVAIASFVSGSLFTIFAERFFTWRRPRISSDTGHLARQSLGRAKQIFGASTATEGRLPYPWKFGEETHTLEVLDSDLRQSAARINQKDFTASVEVIRIQLKTVYAATYVRRITISSPIRDVSPQERQERINSQKIADRQYEAARSGMDAIEPALNQLDKIEKNA